MGFYIEAKNKEGHALGSKSFRVSELNNVKVFYKALGLEKELSENDWSGDKTEKDFSLEQIKNAIQYIEENGYHDKEDVEDLHPLVAAITGMYNREIDVEKEKEFTLQFFDVCKKIAEQDGKVRIYFG
jgi:hypothetical protein